MFEWLKKYRFRIAVITVIAAVLAASYWYGGASPGSHGWAVSDSKALLSEAATASSYTWSPALIEGNSLAELSEKAEESLSEAEASENTPTSEKESEASVYEVSSSVNDHVESTADDPSAQPNSENLSEPGSEAAEEYELKCTISISCGTVLDNMDKLDKNKHELVPSDGWLFSETEVVFSDGESAFDLLLRVCRDNGIHFESAHTPLSDNAYIEGIGNIYEFDCGSLSGWMYNVDGEFPNYSCSDYIIQNNDKINFVYTCDLGKDVGGDYYGQNR